MSCSNESQQPVNHSVHDDIIQQDLYNKQRELNILREIRIAQNNQDEDAFKFFMQEFMEIPRLSLTREQKQHPDYKPWLTDDIIKSESLMDLSHDYIRWGIFTFEKLVYIKY